jgi:putative nucleotidyltransferase with HDIG domain
MASMDDRRAGVRKRLPEVDQIRNLALRAKVVEAWACAPSQSEFTSIDEIKPSGNPDTPPLEKGTQSQHLRAVAPMANAMADALEEIHGNIGVDRDLLWACGLCHDLGKPFEFSPRNQERRRKNVAAAGHPSIRHSGYGVYVALTVGLPEAVAHTAGAHSAEGQFITRSLENTLVHFADDASWRVMERAGFLVL